MVKTIIGTTLLLFAWSSVAHGGAAAAAHGATKPGQHADVSFQVSAVNPGSPAAAAGFQVNDIIKLIDGKKLATQDDFAKILAAYQPGETVPVTVGREGKSVELSLTFGARPDGGVSIGVSIQISVMGADTGAQGNMTEAERGAGTVSCLAWVDETYRIDAMLNDLGLDLAAIWATTRECIGGTQTITRYCDNVFKVHCGGLDLLAEIAEAQVHQCEQQLNESLGLQMRQYKGWKACAEGRVFDRYSMKGEPTDSKACRAAFLEGCGTNIDVAIETSAISAAQQQFVTCCSADALESRDDDSDNCRMIDDGFSRGPCHDRSVCVDRLTNDWLHCATIE